MKFVEGLIIAYIAPSIGEGFLLGSNVLNGILKKNIVITLGIKRRVNVN